MQVKFFNLNTPNKNMNDRNLSQSNENFTFSNVVIINRLGRGSTSHVFKVQSIRTKKYYAMKVIDKFSNEYDQESLLQQINIHKNLDHKHICHFVKHFEDNDNHYILTEYCRNGQITKFLMKSVNQSKILKVLKHVGMALNYMHNEKGFAHGDLKLSNILINGQYLKLCDFGFSVNLKSKKQGKNSKNGPFGTLLYMSPQILKNNCNQYYKQADIWALGICLLTLMNQRNPYTAQASTLLKKKIINSQHIQITNQNFPDYSVQLLQLVKRMLDPDYKNRIKIEQILQSRVLKKLQKIQNPKILKQIEEITNVDDSIIKQQYEILIESQQQQSQGQEVKDINKSVFNQTVDTQTSLLSNHSHSNLCIQDCKIWTFCLKPQKHKTDNQGYIQIMSDHSIRIKVQNVEYKIQADGSSLQILKGFKNCRKYNQPQILNNQKISNLYNYGAELIQIFKKNQCLGEEIINNIYFWVTKKSISCLISRQIILQRILTQQTITYKRVGQEQKDSLNKSNQLFKFVGAFQKGEKILLKKYLDRK